MNESTGDCIDRIRAHIEQIPLIHEEDVDCFINGISRLPEGIQQELYDQVCKHKGFGEVLVGNFIAKKEAFTKCNKEALDQVFEEEKKYLATI